MDMSVLNALNFCRERTIWLRAERYAFLRRMFRYLYIFHAHSYTGTGGISCLNNVIQGTQYTCVSCQIKQRKRQFKNNFEFFPRTS